MPGCRLSFDGYVDQLQKALVSWILMGLISLRLTRLLTKRN